MTKARSIANVIRRVFLERARRYEGQDIAISLSGGVDSCAVLAAFMEVGIEPLCLSYTPSTHESTDFVMAQQTAENLGLKFEPVVVDMGADNLEALAREVIGHGWHSKVQVESLIPIMQVVKAAGEQCADVFCTGDQSDGYFSLSRSTASVVRYLDTPDEIDAIRMAYYERDKSCSGMIAVLAEEWDMGAEFMFRDARIYKAFLGSIWREVNKPRVKEPIKLAFEDWFTPDAILVRKVQVNLHKGDSGFGDALASTLMEHIPGQWLSPRGLYAAIARGEV